MTILTSDHPIATAGIAGAIVAFGLTLALVPLTIRLARRTGVIDEPGERSSHTIATPRLGGIAVMVGASAGLVAGWLTSSEALDASTIDGLHPAVLIALAALGFGVIGLADDLMRGIPVSVRLAGQAAVAAGALAPWVASQSGNGRVASILTPVVAAIGAMAYVNAFNFMDGVNGISGAVAIVVGADLVLLGAIEDHGVLIVLGAVLAGAAGGFLPHNLRPATVFLGDSGSYFLGGWIAATGVVALTVGIAPLAVVAVAVPYFADTTITLARRIARGADWRASHHEHIYQQLIELGWPHPAVAALVASASALCAALGLASLAGGAALPIAAGVGIVATSLCYLALPGRIRAQRARSSDRPATLRG